MKEITRIHIAKVSYEIEIEAKKELEAYLRTLESYSKDTEIIDDVEIRITEILAERGVQKGGVISAADVDALKSQLGDPSEFADEADMEPTKITSDPSRKLYRDTDHAVLGGVLSGVAAFFKVDAIWVRLVFIILALASFGTALLVYIVLWAAVPPARTAADKLQMTGRAVTVESIRELNENEATRSSKKGSGRRVLLAFAGVVALCIALAGAAAVVGLSILAFTGNRWEELSVMPGSGFFMAAFVLALISGVLFTALMTLAAYAAFAGKATKRVLISGAVIIGLGLTTFGIAAATAQYGAFVRNQEIRENTRETAITVPSGSQAVTSMTVDVPGVDVEYVVTKDAPRAVLQTVSKEGADSLTVAIQRDGDVLKLKAEKPGDRDCRQQWCWWDAQTKLTVYGPALSTVTAVSDSQLSYVASNQAPLTVVAEKNATVALSGSISALSATLHEDATLRATDAAILKAEARLDTSAQLTLATVQSLIVTSQNACPSNAREARVSVERVTDANMTLNGTSMPIESTDTGCLEIEIEDGRGEM